MIETPDRRVIGIEVKSSATVAASDFTGLRYLASAAGANFALCLVLHDHDKVLPFGDRMNAAPISSLWQ